MRTLVILLMVIIIGLFAVQPGISGSVTAYQGGKVYRGWVDDKGYISIYNDYGRRIMYGHVNRMGGIEIHDEKNDDSYSGRVSGFGKCYLNSRKGGLTLRIELER